MNILKFYYHMKTIKSVLKVSLTVMIIGILAMLLVYLFLLFDVNKLQALFTTTFDVFFFEIDDRTQRVFTSALLSFLIFSFLLLVQGIVSAFLYFGLKKFVKNNEIEFSSYQEAKRAFERELWKAHVVAINEKDAKKLQRLKN